MWKDIKGYEGLYQVSDDGQVRRIFKTTKTKLLKPRGKDYPVVALCKNGKSKTRRIHRIVAETFIERPEGTTEVNHIDGNHFNNSVSNLEWVTQKANLFHAMVVLKKAPFGKQPRRVRCMNLDTKEVVAIFPSVSEAARHVGTMYARAAITQACKGVYDTAYGCKWEYID